MYRGQSGEIAWNLIKESNVNILTIEADRNLPATKFISLMNKLRDMNIPNLEMVVSDSSKGPNK